MAAEVRKDFISLSKGEQNAVVFIAALYAYLLLSNGLL